MHGDYSKRTKKWPNCATEEQSSMSSLAVFLWYSHIVIDKTHVQSSDHNRSHRHKRAACYQRLARLA